MGLAFRVILLTTITTRKLDALIKTWTKFKVWQSFDKLRHQRLALT